MDERQMINDLFVRHTTVLSRLAPIAMERAS
jgi:hypothetical protein